MAIILCITGGGTGGHLMIAQALSEAAKTRGYEIIFIGSKKGQDRNYFQNSSIFDKVYFLNTLGVVNQSGLAKVNAVFKILYAVLKAIFILKKHKIDATYSVGGFSAAPASIATLLMLKPLFIHEQNAVEGKLNKLLKPFAKSFINAYDDTSPVSGYPVRDIFYKTARVREKIETVIFLGGSHGAKTINDLALEMALFFKKNGIKIIHQAGASDLDRVLKRYLELEVDVELYGFTKELPKLISKADFAISRSGASTLWELTTNGCPAFFIPYPYAAGDHQYYNAKFIVENGMGWCQREGDDLKEKLLDVLKNPNLKQKSEKLLRYAKHDVANKMLDLLEKRVSCRAKK